MAALIIEFTGFLDIDPLLDMAFGFVLLWASWGILADATHLLMDGTPGDIDLPTIASRMSELGGVKVVHHVHGWALTSGRCVFSAHIRVGDGDEQSMPEAAHKFLKEEFGFYFSTIQIEKRCLDERAVAEIDQAFDPKSGAQTPVG